MTPRSADDPPERENPNEDEQRYNDPVPKGQFAHDVTPWRSAMTQPRASLFDFLLRPDAFCFCTDLGGRRGSDPL